MPAQKRELSQQASKADPGLGKQNPRTNNRSRRGRVSVGTDSANMGQYDTNMVFQAAASSSMTTRSASRLSRHSTSESTHLTPDASTRSCFLDTIDTALTFQPEAIAILEGLEEGNQLRPIIDKIDQLHRREKRLKKSLDVMKLRLQICELRRSKHKPNATSEVGDVDTQTAFAGYSNGTEVPGTSQSIPRALDPFEIKLDQVSCRQVIDGDTGLLSINHAIDDFVSEILHNTDGCSSYTALRRPACPSFGNRKMLRLLDNEELSKDKRDLILDAMIHEHVSSVMLHTYFQGHFSICGFMAKQYRSVDEAYDKLFLTEPWSASQRWRSIGIAACISQCSRQNCVDKIVDTTLGQISQLLAHATGIPRKRLDQVLKSRAEDLKVLFWEAHTLSATLKRDILSVQLKVIGAPMTENLEQYLPWDPEHSNIPWSNMRGKVGEKVISTYALGLKGILENGGSRYLVLPKVITEEFMRQFS